jgi:DNA-binding response OmpR family regulator
MTRAILLVEDDAVIATSTTFALRVRGELDVRAVATLAGARAAIQQRTPDVIVLDLALGDGSGMDLLRELRAGAPPGRAMPVIVATAQQSPGLEDAVGALGAHLLCKPYAVDRLAELVVDVCETAS